MEVVPPLLERGVRVIDLSADYRLRDPNVYAQWYGESHDDLANLAQAVYGLPELYGDEIADGAARRQPRLLPADGDPRPGPAGGRQLHRTGSIIIDSKSGVSGGGPRRRSCRSTSRSATRASRPTPSARTATRRRSSRR